MAVTSIANPNLFRVMGDAVSEEYYGCDQQWYSTEWQRLAGCGPVVASNIVFYATRKALAPGEAAASMGECALLMEEVWEHVTPTSEGIPTTEMFREAVLLYLKSKGLRTQSAVMDVPEDPGFRPTLAEIADFLEGALSNDAPVAFLNLCNGEEENLDEWHWVTIISVDCADKENQIHADILDAGVVKRIDLALWYTTTTLGGGFVWFAV